MSGFLDDMSNSLTDIGDYVEDNNVVFIIGGCVAFIIILYYMFFR